MSLLLELPGCRTTRACHESPPMSSSRAGLVTAHGSVRGSYYLLCWPPRGAQAWHMQSAACTVGGTARLAERGSRTLSGSGKKKFDLQKGN